MFHYYIVFHICFSCIFADHFYRYICMLNFAKQRKHPVIALAIRRMTVRRFKCNNLLLITRCSPTLSLHQSDCTVSEMRLALWVYVAAVSPQLLFMNCSLSDSMKPSRQVIVILLFGVSAGSVSYTHLDVYKRQILQCTHINSLPFIYKFLFFTVQFFRTSLSKSAMSKPIKHNVYNLSLIHI